MTGYSSDAIIQVRPYSSIRPILLSSAGILQNQDRSKEEDGNGRDNEQRPMLPPNKDGLLVQHHAKAPKGHYNAIIVDPLC